MSRRHPSQTALMIFLLVLLAAGNAFAGSFEEANEKYRAGDFKGAAQAYQEIVRSGHGTAAVQFNLGNSLLRLGKKAEALLAFERALKADPRNSDLRWNIGVVRSMLTDRDEEGPSAWLGTLRRAAGWISIDETAWTLAGLAFLLVLAGWAHFATDGRYPRLKSLQAFLLALVVLSAFMFMFQRREDARRRAIVLDKEVTLRYGPAFSETKAFVLHEGAAVDVLDESGDWRYVSFGDNAGWLPKKTAEIV